MLNARTTKQQMKKILPIYEQQTRITLKTKITT